MQCRAKPYQHEEKADAVQHGKGRTLRNAYIKFPADSDYERVYETLMAHSSVSRLSNGVYCIPWGSLALLEASEVTYSFASEADLANAQPLWNFAAPPTR